MVSRSALRSFRATPFLQRSFRRRGHPAVSDDIGHLLDAGTAAAFDFPQPTPPLGALRVARGTVQGRPLTLVAIDPGLKRGAIGVTEARALTAVFEALITWPPVPLVLVLESSGARMDMGLEMLVAFRRLLA